MRLFQLSITTGSYWAPQHTSALVKLENLMLEIAGEYVELTARIAQRNKPGSPVHTYQVACEPAEFATIVDALRLSVPDAEFVAADMGEAWVSHIAGRNVFGE